MYLRVLYTSTARRPVSAAVQNSISDMLLLMHKSDSNSVSYNQTSFVWGVFLLWFDRFVLSVSPINVWCLMRGIFQGIFKICQTVTSVIWGFPWRIRNWPSVYLTERLVWDWGGALSAALQYCCLWSTLRQLQPGALLVSSGPWWSCAALLVVFIHLLSSVFLQWTHYLVQRLYWAGMTGNKLHWNGLFSVL